MPLAMLGAGDTGLITRIGGKPETKKFLEGLGFVVGAPVTVVSEMGGNIICSIKDSRVAISKELAKKINV